MDNFQGLLPWTFSLLTLILMGDWYSEGCNRKSKEISARVEMLVIQHWSLARK
jgi:hypothetical protein